MPSTITDTITKVREYFNLIQFDETKGLPEGTIGFLLVCRSCKGAIWLESLRRHFHGIGKAGQYIIRNCIGKLFILKPENIDYPRHMPVL
jgi:hypothetical protein